MRILPACTAAAILFGAGTAAAAPGCPKPYEQAAFEVVQLKSALMVGALSCGVSARYDAFMTRFQPYILQEQQVMDRFFHRTSGTQAQADEDQYVTLLANTQSQDSITDGKAYCGGVSGLFTQVAAITQDADLESLADAQESAAAGLPPLCGSAPVTAPAVVAANAAAARSASPKPAPVEAAATAASIQNLAAEMPATAPAIAAPAAVAPASAASLAALSRQIQALQAQLAALQSGAQSPTPAADRTASAAIPRPNTPS